MNKFIIVFIILLALIGGGYYFSISQKENTTPQEPEQQAHTMEDVGDKPVAQSHRSYEMEVTSKNDNINPQQLVQLTYKIKNDKGKILKNFEVAHEKIMHFIVVRHDLQQFQHLHPEFNQSTGEFRVNITFPTDGPYRIFPDFTPGDDNPQKLPVTVSKDIEVGDQTRYTSQSVTPDTANKKTYGDYQVTFDVPKIKAQEEFMYSLTIEKNGQPVNDLEKYLGALGHSVILKAATLDFIHTHALEEKSTGPTIKFSTVFPESGVYKIFTQFQHQGKVVTVDYTIKVN